MSYQSTSDLEAYFAKRLNTNAFDQATGVDVVKASAMADKILDNLAYRGEKTSTSQEHQFPRNDDINIPDQVKWAHAEIVLALLEGNTVEAQREEARVTAARYDKVALNYDSENLPEHIAADIPSSAAWRFIRPFVRDFRTVRVERVS